MELDEKIKDAIREWRRKDYEEVTQVTERLLKYWFKEEHYFEDGRGFEFWRCQKEAIEALIYLYEVCEYDSLYSLSQGFNVRLAFDPTRDLWPQYCFRMATGSGKTFVMAMALVWQYFNNLYENKNDRQYSRHFLLIAPNLIVLDRLKDFEDEKIFYEWPFFIPDEWRADFDLQTVVQTEDVPEHSKGVLHITNVQQFYERTTGDEEENPIEAMLGPKPVKGEEFKSRVTLYDILGRYDDLMVMNDEAHHAHIETEWQSAMETLNHQLTKSEGAELTMQLDFSATPMDANGNLFPHIIYDYPLAEAISDEIVKRPHIGTIKGAPEPIEKDFVRRNQIQIDEGVELLEKFKEELDGTGKKPVLFVMCDRVENANKVGAYLENEKGYKGKVLVIHTYKRKTRDGFAKGDIRKDELPKIRKAAKEIDTNEYEIIVSVMMLKEGWDVKNVCAVVPLRAFESRILVEQTLGRGLRRMFPENEELEEKLIVVEHPRFKELWEAEINQKGLDVPVTSVREAYKPSNKISVDQDTLQYDMEIPLVRGGITKISPDLSKINLARLPSKVYTYEEIEVPTPWYIEKDLMSGEITAERVIRFDYTDRHEEYLAQITKAILYKVGSTSQFADLVPIVKRYIENFLFDIQVDIKESEVVKKLNHLHVRNKIKDILVRALQEISTIETDYKVPKYYKLSETKTIHTSNPVFPAEKTVFNYLPYHKRSTYEKEFMVYLDGQDEVLAYTKVLSRFPLRIPYYDENGILRHYLPDFIVKTGQGFYLIETKGTAFADIASVRMKDKSATKWCENLCKLTNESWSYVKVIQNDFEQLKYMGFHDMIKTLSSE